MSSYVYSEWNAIKLKLRLDFLGSKSMGTNSYLETIDVSLLCYGLHLVYLFSIVKKMKNIGRLLHFDYNYIKLKFHVHLILTCSRDIMSYRQLITYVLVTHFYTNLSKYLIIFLQWTNVWGQNLKTGCVCR